LSKLINITQLGSFQSIYQINNNTQTRNKLNTKALVMHILLNGDSVQGALRPPPQSSPHIRKQKEGTGDNIEE